jgi:hypothetical protein
VTRDGRTRAAKFTLAEPAGRVKGEGARAPTESCGAESGEKTCAGWRDVSLQWEELHYLLLKGAGMAGRANGAANRKRAVREAFHRLGLHTRPAAIVRTLAEFGIAVGEDLVRLVRVELLKGTAETLRERARTPRPAPRPPARRPPQPGRRR